MILGDDDDRFNWAMKNNEKTIGHAMLRLRTVHV